MRLAEQAEKVAAELLPNGKRDGAEWRCGSVDGDEGKSLGVHLTGSKAGVWRDFSADVGGDLLDLWMKVRGIGLPEAMQQAAAFVGVHLVRENRAKTFAKPKKVEGTKAAGGAVMRWLSEDRKLTPDTVKAYRVAAKGETHVLFPHFRDGEWKNYKLRSIADKKDMRTAGGCEQMLWGWQAIDKASRKVVICEGELDAMSLYQYGYPALSVFSGAGNHAWIENEFEHLEGYDDIYLCFDNDDAGRKGCSEVVERLGRDRCMIVTLPKKDANECLMSGVTKAQIDEAFSCASSLAPQNLRGASAFLPDVLNLFYPAREDSHGVLLPWPRVMQMVQIRKSELSIWTGISGHGKSQLLGQVMLSAADQGERICIASLEMKPGRTMQRMIRQALGTAHPPADEIKAAVEWMSGKFWFYDFVGETETDPLLEIFTYARKRHGCTQFVIDNLMMLDASEEDLDKQSRTVKKLLAFKSDHDAHVHLVAHARKSQDESKPPRKMDVKGSGNIVNQADNVFSVWRNKPKEEGKADRDAPDCTVFVDKQRNGEWEGYIDLWYDRPSLAYVDQIDGRIKRMSFSSKDFERQRLAAGEMVEF